MTPAESLWTSFSKTALDWVYPSKCPLCGFLSDSVPCEACVSHMEPALPDFVADQEGPLSYRACVFAYKGRAAQAVKRLKYGRSTALAEFMAVQVTNRVKQVTSAGDLLVPVPIHASRRSSRGFNQSELCTVGDHGLEIRTDLLARVRATRYQAGLSLKDREENLKNAFKASPGVADCDLVLIDDVVTTGRTAKECAKVLMEAGARSVGIVAFCGKLD